MSPEVSDNQHGNEPESGRHA